MQVNSKKATLSLLENGDLFFFGSGESGQLGTGKRTSEYYPVRVKIPGEKAERISCGIAHTLVLTTQGKIYACGLNSSGQLGTGNKKPYNTLHQIAGFEGQKAITISAGYHSAAITLRGEVFVWGPTPLGEFLLPHQICKNNENMIMDIKQGDGFTLLFDVRGYLWGFGSNSFGQLGTGNTDRYSGVVRSKALENKRIKMIGCGKNFVLALGSDKPGIAIDLPIRGRDLRRSRGDLDADIDKGNKSFDIDAFGNAFQSPTKPQDINAIDEAYKGDFNSPDTRRDQEEQKEGSPEDFHQTSDLDELSISKITSGTKEKKLSIHDDSSPEKTPDGAEEKALEKAKKAGKKMSKKPPNIKEESEEQLSSSKEQNNSTHQNDQNVPQTSCTPNLLTQNSTLTNTKSSYQSEKQHPASFDKPPLSPSSKLITFPTTKPLTSDERSTKSIIKSTAKAPTKKKAKPTEDEDEEQEQDQEDTDSAQNDEEVTQSAQGDTGFKTPKRATNSSKDKTQDSSPKKVLTPTAKKSKGTTSDQQSESSGKGADKKSTDSDQEKGSSAAVKKSTKVKKDTDLSSKDFQSPEGESGTKTNIKSSGSPEGKTESKISANKYFGITKEGKKMSKQSSMGSNMGGADRKSVV